MRLLLMQRTAARSGYDGPGDFMLDPVGLLRRRGEREIAPFIFAGIQILHRRLFDGAPAETFSMQPALGPRHPGRAALRHRP